MPGRVNAKESRLTVPSNRPVNVAFVLTDGATMIDYAGPWEVFQDVYDEGPDPGTGRIPFRLYVVSDSTAPITGSGGLRIVPSFTFDDAPPPDVIVVPAQRGRSNKMMNWLRDKSVTAAITMSVCTGAFVLGDAGMLDGLRATTHHSFYHRLSERFPKVKLVRDARFVENEHISTAGGLSSGIDLALRVVERYFGRGVAQATADYMEYRSKDWVVD